jgi:PIN domain nuclease of toxin-antitoxin system
LTAVLLDTHAWAWSLVGDDRLSRRAVEAIGEADPVFVSPITFFEIGQKVRIGRWPEMVPLIDRLPNVLAEQGGRVAALEPETCLAAALLAWTHRDPFDRLLAATALRSGFPLVSVDAQFDDEIDGKHILRIW